MGLFGRKRRGELTVHSVTGFADEDDAGTPVGTPSGSPRATLPASNAGRVSVDPTTQNPAQWTDSPQPETLNGYQAVIYPWSVWNFGDTEECPTDLAALGLGEEVGEVLRAILKREQGIRGTYSEWTEELRKEIGDVFIKLIDVCSREGWELSDVVWDRWKSIRHRDFRSDRLGHGLPDA